MAIKISELTAVTSIAGTEEIPVVQSATTKKATANDLLGYKVYSALLTYDTLNDEFNNTAFRDMFGDITFTRNSAGDYTIDSAGGLFTQDKTFIFLGQNDNNGGGGNGNFVFYSAFWNSSSEIGLKVLDVDVVNAETTASDLLTNLSLEIRVYP